MAIIKRNKISILYNVYFKQAGRGPRGGLSRKAA